MTASEFVFSGSRWFITGGALLELEAVLTLHASSIAVTLVDAKPHMGNPPIRYWQRCALVEWVADHQEILRSRHGHTPDDDTWDMPPPGWNGLAPSGWESRP